MDAIINTDYDFGFCTSLSPIAPPPANPGFWCDTYNRGAEESRCWTSTQNCCFFDINATDPNFPGTGQCVHKDPCPDGFKVCNSQCYPLRTSDGIMTCARPQSMPSGNGVPKYSQMACIGKESITGEQWGSWYDYICQSVNCDWGISSGHGSSSWAPPGFKVGFTGVVSTDVQFSNGAWVCHQNYILNGNCDAGYCQLKPWPNAAPAPPPTPAPPPAPKKCFPTQCYPAHSATGYACQVKAGATREQIGNAIEWACGDGGLDCSAISGAAPYGPCWDQTKTADEQDINFLGNYVYEKFYQAHCGDYTKPQSPCPKDATACDFGGSAEPVAAPVALPCTPGPTPAPVHNSTAR